MIGEVQGMLDLDELIDGLLVAIQRNVPSDYVSLNDIGPDTDRVISVVTPELPDHLYRLFGEFAFQNPVMLRYMETLDGRPYRFSDVTTPEALHALELYRQVYAPIGVEHQMAFTLPATPGRVIAIAISRADSRLHRRGARGDRTLPALPDPGVAQRDRPHRPARRAGGAAAGTGGR